MNELKTSNLYSVRWDSRDDDGQHVSSGVYLVHFTARSLNGRWAGLFEPEKDDSAAIAGVSQKIAITLKTIPSHYRIQFFGAVESFFFMPQNSQRYQISVYRSNSIFLERIDF